MSEGRKFSLRRLFLWVALAAVLCGAYVALGSAMRQADLAAQRTAYGGHRFTRQEAESIAGRPLRLPDSEFLEILGLD